MTPALASAATCSGLTDSGAIVVNSTGRCRRASINAASSAAVIGRISLGSCAPLRAIDRCGPSRCRPRKPGTLRFVASSPAAMAAAVISGVSVISVGRSAVVPNGACARQMVSIEATSGWSLSITPPPPLTWMSTKPGTSRPPPVSTRETPAGILPEGTMASISPPFTTRAASSCQASPSKIRAPVRAKWSLIRFQSPCEGWGACRGRARGGGRRLPRTYRTKRSAAAGR